MVERLADLERAEELAIGLLESAGQAMAELKEVQANDAEKNFAFAKSTDDFYKKLELIRDILSHELDLLAGSKSAPSRRPGIDHLAITEWEAKVITDNLQELIRPETRGDGM